MKDFDPIDNFVKSEIEKSSISYSDSFWQDFKVNNLPKPSFFNNFKQFISGNLPFIGSLIFIMFTSFLFFYNNSEFTKEDIPGKNIENMIKLDSISQKTNRLEPKMSKNELSQPFTNKNIIKQNPSNVLENNVDNDQKVNFGGSFTDTSYIMLSADTLINIKQDTLEKKTIKKKKKYIIW
jgi:hypothetical protein